MFIKRWNGMECCPFLSLSPKRKIPRLIKGFFFGRMEICHDDFIFIQKRDEEDFVVVARERPNKLAIYCRRRLIGITEGVCWKTLFRSTKDVDSRDGGGGKFSSRGCLFVARRRTSRANNKRDEKTAFSGIIALRKQSRAARSQTLLLCRLLTSAAARSLIVELLWSGEETRNHNRFVYDHMIVTC